MSWQLSLAVSKHSPGQEASSPEGMMDEKDIIRKMKELGLKVLE